MLTRSPLLRLSVMGVLLAVTSSAWGQNTFPSAGNVGVGTMTPGAPVDVNGRIRMSYGTDFAEFFMGLSGGVTGIHLGSRTNMPLTLYTNSSGPRVILDTTGRLGVGTVPSAMLHVAGTSMIEGLLSATQLGVGTTSPQASLDVSGGRIRMTNGTDFSEFFTGLSGGVTGLHIGSRTNMPVAFYANSSAPRVILDTNGNLGVGTVPAMRLHVAGDAQIDGNIAAKYQDVAEWVPTRQRLTAGTLVVIDPSAINTVVAVDHPYDTKVVGVVTERPGVILGEGGENKAKVAQSGRVKVKVDAQFGAIAPGDLLVSSPTPGHAMRSVPMVLGETQIHRPGTLIGKALEGLDTGQGEILVFLTIQ
jgi:hypothetical protein